MIIRLTGIQLRARTCCGWLALIPVVTGINHINVKINVLIIIFFCVFQNVVLIMIPIEKEIAVRPTLSFLNDLLIEIFEGYLFQIISLVSFEK